MHVYRCIPMQNGSVTVGSSKKADIQITHPNILEEHCIFEYKGGRVYCKSLTPLDEESLIPADTSVWVNNCQLRPAVSYLVSPGASIFVGDMQSEALVAEFDEADTGVDSMAKMLMKGMVSNSTSEIQSQVDKLI